jgi:hypothetical protein
MSGDRIGGRRRSSADGAQHRPARDEDRAQTVLDFVVGMSVFLAVVAFTFAFVPSLLEPYSAGEGATVIIAERGAAQLAESSLAGAESTAVLSPACTLAFFDGTSPGTAESEWGCNWKANADVLHAELGVAEFRGVNVTITQNGTVGAIGPDDVPMRAGADLPRSQSVAAASRIVDIGGDPYRLTLRVW